jgi:hypothetical protein
MTLWISFWIKHLVVTKLFSFVHISKGLLSSGFPTGKKALGDFPNTLRLVYGTK